MASAMRGKDSSRCLLLLAAVLMVESAQPGGTRAKLNSIKSSLGGETPAQAANRSAGMFQGLAFSGSKKGKNLGQEPGSVSSRARRLQGADGTAAPWATGPPVAVMTGQRALPRESQSAGPSPRGPRAADVALEVMLRLCRGHV
ncbi:Dickkopf-related protein 2 [Galemys pyrenaicus]|uniref:Dickkopf-related protein 2 n=1 Tax=Galemys pyrenaicus TaxID=202257 RepID=A0A8J6DRP0_GALPY|nr:Dickkopf-related protein 2 [Galemys pyrenaicus]